MISGTGGPEMRFFRLLRAICAECIAVFSYIRYDTIRDCMIEEGALCHRKIAEIQTAA